MTMLNSILMYIGFALWFWAGYKIGRIRGSEGRNKKELIDELKALRRRFQPNP